MAPDVDVSREKNHGMDAEWVSGEHCGLGFPVHVGALRTAGAAWLTDAFRAAGTLDSDNRVLAVGRLDEFHGGSTGRKAVLDVTYERADAGLPTQLFVKFSRDLDDEMRDRGKRQMDAEVRFALLSQIPEFPVAVPRCMFADFHAASGSGVLITERVRFGTAGIEPQRAKARDYELSDALPYYEALVSALARLAGSHRAGRLPADVMARFEPRLSARTAGTRTASAAVDAADRVERYVSFARRYPQLLPASLRNETFFSLLRKQVPRSVDCADALRAQAQRSAEGLTAFCHWNANIDNAWFWRDGSGEIHCGLLDWGNVGQLNMVTALSSCLVFAEPDFVLANLDYLLARFALGYEDAGGGVLSPSTLQWQLRLQMVAGGLRWPLGAVALLERQVPELDAVVDRFDARIAEDEFARTQLHMLTSYLTLWRWARPDAVIDHLVG